MSELLLELFSAEIPSMFQRNAASAYEKIFTEYFVSLNIEFKNIEVYSGPRRICIYINGLPSIIPSCINVIKGPRISAPNKSITGFCRSNNIKQSDLTIKEVNRVSSYFYIYKKEDKKVSDTLFYSLSDLISKYVWPKSMYWNNHRIKWVRPLHNILCIFNGEVIPFKYGHLKANNIAYGHRFMSFKSCVIDSYIAYRKYLESNFVVLNSKDRIAIIKNKLQEIAISKNLVVKDDPYLLEEVSGLVEYPTVLLGKIKTKFLSVPSELLINVMRNQQKYFSVFYKNGCFAPYFIFVSNIKPQEESSVISGNENVLSARLSDALYFYNQDLKTSLLDKSKKLDKVVFHTKLGSLQDKTQRLIMICRFINPHDKHATKAASICKSDIVSEVVIEFPNLQGFMGYHYASIELQNKNVSEAIRDHYKPQGSKDPSPKDSGAILALADKIDSLCGLILANERPSGSKDPYSMRRHALGVVRIMLDNNLKIDLYKLVIYSLKLYKDQTEYTGACINRVIQFLVERVRYFFKYKYSTNLIDATLNIEKEFYLSSFKLRINAVSNFINSESGKYFLESYKRINNLLGGYKSNKQINELALTSRYEIELYNYIKSSNKKIEVALSQNEYDEVFQTLEESYFPVTAFLDNILIKDKNKRIADNRMLLLERIRSNFNQVAKFNKL